jgi:hypothetical protein
VLDSILRFSGDAYVETIYHLYEEQHGHPA